METITRDTAGKKRPASTAPCEDAEDQWDNEADFSGFNTTGLTSLPEITRDEGDDIIEERLTTVEGISEGVGRHVLVGDPEVEFERFMATMREL